MDTDHYDRLLAATVDGLDAACEDSKPVDNGTCCTTKSSELLTLIGLEDDSLDTFLPSFAPRFTNVILKLLWIKATNPLGLRQSRHELQTLPTNKHGKIFSQQTTAIREQQNTQT